MHAVFLDRDGVLNECRVIDGRPFPPLSPDEFTLLPGVTDACRRMKDAGFMLVVATNQPDIGRGTQSLETVKAMHDILCGSLPIDAIYMCPHGGDPPCDCRKPKPGMLHQAARDLGIDLRRSFMIGDRWRDIDCGHAAGCQTVFIDYQYDEALRQTPDAVVSNIAQAADWILSHSPYSTST